MAWNTSSQNQLIIIQHVKRGCWLEPHRLRWPAPLYTPRPDIPCHPAYDNIFMFDGLQSLTQSSLISAQIHQTVRRSCVLVRNRF